MEEEVPNVKSRRRRMRRDTAFSHIIKILSLK